VKSIALLACLLLFTGCSADVQVGSKSFTESVILADMLVLMGREGGVDIEPRRELGGSQVLFYALSVGEIDAYPEYTGTIRLELFGKETFESDDQVAARLRERGILMSKPIGFNNSYGIAVTKAFAAERGLRKISDLSRHDDLRFGFSNEFVNRKDGWPGLSDAYKLRPKSIRGLQHSLAYKAIESGDSDVIDVYTTDPHIAEHDLFVLDDDRGYFPRYDGVFLYREDLATRAPEVIAAIKQLEGTIDDGQMLAINTDVEEGTHEQRAAADFLEEEFAMRPEVIQPSLARRVWRSTWEHLLLVVVSLSMAIVISVPLGVFAAKNRQVGQFLVSIVEIIQTIPGLALLVLIVSLLAGISLPAIGALPVIIALLLYSLLPIVRNTMAGIENVPGSLLESAEAMGLPPTARLSKIELPLASPLILAGIKTTAVINVGYAALGGLIGAGGYGQPIMAGLRLMDAGQMLEGAVPAAILALLVKGGFTLLEKRIVPRGLRLAE